MIYVIDNMASKIKRNPTQKEIDQVNRQEKLKKEIYNHYIDLYADKKVTGIDAGLCNMLWNRYLKEEAAYNDLWNTYIGYCY